jgi:hypothetical protein
MGFESIVYGRIEGATYRAAGQQFRQLQKLNRQVIRSLPLMDEWPFLTRHMFALPGPFPHGGLYRCQVIHLGASFKELEGDLSIWLGKFEAVLRRLYWFSARLQLEGWMGDFRFEWVPEDDSIERMFSERPQPIAKWHFSTNFRLD